MFYWICPLSEAHSGNYVMGFYHYLFCSFQWRASIVSSCYHILECYNLFSGVRLSTQGLDRGCADYSCGWKIHKFLSCQVIPGNDQYTNPTNQGATGSTLDRTS